MKKYCLTLVLSLFLFSCEQPSTETRITKPAYLIFGPYSFAMSRKQFDSIELHPPRYPFIIMDEKFTPDGGLSALKGYGFEGLPAAYYEIFLKKKLNRITAQMQHTHGEPTAKTSFPNASEVAKSNADFFTAAWRRKSYLIRIGITYSSKSKTYETVIQAQDTLNSELGFAPLNPLLGK